MDTGDWAISVPTGYRVSHWEITAPIGAGSWGGVYEATLVDPDPDLPPRVAVKFLPTQALTARRLRHLADMADRETQAYARLDHPRLIRRYETIIVTDPAHPSVDGAVAVIMERAERSLADLLDSRGGSPPCSAQMVVQICDGLAHMHAQGWVHGDLKPANILIMSDGSLRLADFGLATELDGTHGYLPPAGSLDYTPPERWTEPLSERGTAIRPSADIWALGVTVYQLLTGSSPFPGTSARARSAAAAEYVNGRAELVLSPEVRSGWRTFVADCLNPEPDARPSAADLAVRARRLATDPEARLPRHQAPRWRRMVTAAAVLLVVGGVGGASTLLARDPPEEEPTGYERWFRTDAGIPPQYYDLIVQAGTMCEEPGVSPALVAAMLAAESNFDPNLSDPAKDEYGIARWTPRVLQYHLPPGQRDETPQPPFPPEMSIPAVGRFLCQFAPALEEVPGDPALKLAAAYRTSTNTVREAGGVPDRLRPYTDRVAENLRRYQPAPPS